MKTFKALVKDGKRVVVIESEYDRKSDFIKDLRHNGYKVNPRKVKEKVVFDYICNNTDMHDWDWDLKSVIC